MQELARLPFSVRAPSTGRPPQTSRARPDRVSGRARRERVAAGGQVAVSDRSAVVARPGSRVTSLDAGRWPAAEAVIRSGPVRASSQRS